MTMESYHDYHKIYENPNIYENVLLYLLSLSQHFIKV